MAVKYSSSFIIICAQNSSVNANESHLMLFVRRIMLFSFSKHRSVLNIINANECNIELTHWHIRSQGVFEVEVYLSANHKGCQFI